MALTDNQKARLAQATRNQRLADRLVEMMDKVYLETIITDVSAEASYYVISPYAGQITQIKAVTDTAILTADGTITPKIATVAVTGGLVTMPVSGAAAGNIATATPTALNTVTAGQAIELLVSGAGAAGTGPRVKVNIEITRTAPNVD